MQMEAYKAGFLSFFVVLYLLLHFFHSKRLKITHTIRYQYILLLSLFIVSFDLLLAFLQRGNDFYFAGNLILHQMHYAVIIFYYFLVCSYILVLVGNTPAKNISQKIMIYVPLVISFLALIFVPLIAKKRQIPFDSLRLIVSCCNISIAYYLLFVFFYCFRYRKAIGYSEKAAIFSYFILIPLMIVYQWFFKTDNLFVLGTTIIALAFFMTLENPYDYLCCQGKIFNRKAFELVATEVIQTSGKFSLIAILYQHLESNENYHKEESLLIDFEKSLRKEFSCQLFIPQDQYMVFFVDNDKKNGTIKKSLSEFLQKNENSVIKQMDLHIFHYDYQKDFSTIFDIFVLLQDVRDDRLKKIAFFDSNLEIKNRNAFEHERQFIDKNLYTFSSVWCAIIDINDLKVVNDGQGHQAGDVLLKDCATVLTAALGSANDVYRIGGDEFLILQISKSFEEIQVLLEKIENERVLINKKRTFPLHFALGDAFLDKKTDLRFAQILARADSLMYKNKKNMKMQI